MVTTFLALGDSYTIGEGVPLYHSFPYQTVQTLRSAERFFVAPEIIARTGWTTDELEKAIAATRLLPSYDIVSLLIGVNNQYRGRDLAEYTKGFTSLLHHAIRLAANQPGHVFILSIPDWGASPFARQQLPDGKGRDQTRIATEIDAFNASAKNIAYAYEVVYIDITTHSRTFGQPTFEGETAFATDGLHPSRLQYQFWATQLSARILAAL